MSPFRPCAVVPCYNHGAAVGAVVQRLLAHGLDTLIVDDGSAPDTAEVLRGIAAADARVRLSRLPRNAGKGAAVVHGFRQARALGFTHALQLDADGQHALDDVPRFLAEARARPDALVCGQALFDASAPLARRYGRAITHFWVWVETRSRVIADSMCGFRVYPLAPVSALLEHAALAPRMDFDIEIAVRLVWEGVPVVNLPTRVRYPADGVSHFRMLRDNLLISLTHTRLVCGMLRRLPRGPARPQHWSRIAERGGEFGPRFVSAAWRLFGRRAARLAALPAVLWVFLTGAQARRASRGYLERLAAASARGTPAATPWNVLRHMSSFADACIDKLAVWHGEPSGVPIEFRGEEEFQRLQREKRGALFIGSHLGNLEMVRALATLHGLARITAVVYIEHSRRFSAALRAANARFGENLLEISDFGPGTAVMLKERVDRGEILVIVGDRTPAAENGRCARAPFLGAPAPFPQGPVILAHLLECPVYLFFCIKRAGRYSIHLERFAERVVLPPRGRGAAIEAHVARYAGRLEAYCREAPLQWFNFFDFWHEPHRGS
jgi:predicted LPLAT superfamily acyltransferase